MSLGFWTQQLSEQQEKCQFLFFHYKNVERGVLWQFGNFPRHIFQTSKNSLNWCCSFWEVSIFWRGVERRVLVINIPKAFHLCFWKMDPAFSYFSGHSPCWTVVCGFSFGTTLDLRQQRPLLICPSGCQSACVGHLAMYSYTNADHCCCLVPFNICAPCPQIRRFRSGKFYYLEQCQCY